MTDTDTLIEKYLYKELSEAEIQEFEQRMESDTDFADEVELRSVIFAKTKYDFKQELKAARESASSDSKPDYLKWIVGLLILGIIAFLLYQHYFVERPIKPPTINKDSTKDHIADANGHGTYVGGLIAQKHPAPPTFAGENDDAEAWKAAKNAYKNGAYETTVREIEKITSPDTEQQFYLALAHLYDEKYDKSITQFGPIIEQNNINYSPTSKWYVSLAHLKNNQAEQAKEYLQQIVNDKSWKYKEAQKLLNTL